MIKRVRGWLAKLEAGRVLTIRVRLTMWYTAILGLVLVAFCVLIYVSLSHFLYARLDESLKLQSLELQEDGAHTGQSFRLGEEMDHVTPGTSVAVYDAAGQKLLEGTSRWPSDAVADTRQQVLSKGTSLYTTVDAENSGKWRILVASVKSGSQAIAVLELGIPEQEVEQTLQQLMLIFYLAIPVVLAMAAGGGLFLANRALVPIERITRAARRIGAENLSQRIGLRPRADEVGRLAQTFDMMLERLEGAFDRQRQFTADASHELRTPLAVMGSQIDVALQRRRSETEYAEVLNEVRSEVERMTELVGELTALAQADSGNEHLDLEVLPLDELASVVVAHLTPIAVKRKVRLEVNTLAPVLVLGDQTRLTELLINLLDNALKHTPAGGLVQLQVEREGAWAVARVVDTGTGISAEHLPYIFERFYRVDRSRSRAQGGAGLGLAICDWIVRAHKGHIEVSSSPGEGSTFAVFLPLSALATP